MALDRTILLTLTLLAGLAAPASAQQASAGLVVRARSASSGAALPDAAVSLDGRRFLGVTGKDGALRAGHLPPGMHRIQVQFIGHETVDRIVVLRQDEVSDLVFDLPARPIELPPLTVVTHRGTLAVNMREFDQRRNRGNGYYITREDIERVKPTAFSDLLRMIPGMRLDCSAFRDDCQAAMRSAPESGVTTYREGGLAGPLQAEGCPIQYYVDGHYEPHANVNDFNPTDVAAVEVYVHGTQAPARYSIRKNARCGVVLVWLRQSIGGG